MALKDIIFMKIGRKQVEREIKDEHANGSTIQYLAVKHHQSIEKIKRIIKKNK